MNSEQLPGTQSVAEHIGELRTKLLIAVAAIIVGASVAHIFHKDIIAFLLRPAGTQELIFLSPLEPFIFILKVDIIAGILISFPVIIWALFSFVAPALPKATKRLLVIVYLISLLLVLIGLGYAFGVTIPLSLKFLFGITIEGIRNQISAQSYVSFFLTQAVVIVGIFQIPLVMTGAIYLRLLSTRLFRNKRKYIYLVLTIATAIITPTTDVFSLAIVLIPCIAMFEISLAIGKVIERTRKQR